MNDDLTATIESFVGHRNIKKTDVSTVVNIRAGWFSSLFDKFEKGKAALLAEFRQRNTYAYLWLDDWNTDLINEIRCQWDTLGGNVFRIPQTQDIGGLYKKLYQGKWQVFFSNQPLQQDLECVLARGPAEVKQLLTRSGAHIVVTSWFDNTEWFVGWQP